MTLNELKYRVKDKAKKMVDWSKEHKEELLIFGPPVIAGSIAIGKSIAKNHRIAMENKRRELDIYDPQNGQHLFLKKPLTNAEKIELDERRRCGESVTEALWKMGKIYPY